MMRKIILLAVIFFGAWSYYQEKLSSGQKPELEEQHNVTKSSHVGPTATTQSAQRFKCDGRQHCSQMNSRAEAEFFVRNCPNTKMDGDRDGIPCENDSRF